jgi:sulfite exporter TauE/SafE
MTDAQTFQLEEYKALRKEIELYIKEAHSQELYTVIAVGVVWGWLILNHQNHWLLWAIPLIITIVSVIRMIALYRHFKIMAGYIRKTEGAFGVSGWEHRQRPPLKIEVANIVLGVGLFILAVLGLLWRVEIAACHPLCK